MKRIVHLIILLALCSISGMAQQTSLSEMEKLFTWFTATASFDRRYPREKVYVHFDNSAYMEGDSLWYKAYVVRASSLQPTTLSRVLYVDLLNADGQLMTQQIQKLDSLGQADGCFSLALPVRAGYYEVCAYTREMVNWGEEACFSRVFPVFAARQTRKGRVQGGDFRLEQMELPMPEPNKKVTLGCPRPYELKSTRERKLEFYPEGGLRAKGLQQRMAFTLTDGRGHAVDDTIQVFDENGVLLSEVQTEHEHMGVFMLPEGTMGGYALVKGMKKRFPLPIPEADYAVYADRKDEELNVDVMATDEAISAHRLLGLLITNREKVCYFDTLTADARSIGMQIPMKALRMGVNRIQLFDSDGHGLASRLVWHTDEKSRHRCVSLSLSTNRPSYGPFEPASVRVTLTDAESKPVSATMSISIRDTQGNIVYDADDGMKADLLLASELRGYVHHPAAYFEQDDAVHHRMLDLLLMVQGWTAQRFDVMCGADSFRLIQPIEDRYILRGALYKQGKSRLVPMAGQNLSLRMYSHQGEGVEGKAITDAKGCFAFESNVDFTGPFVAQFTNTTDEGKRQWSKLTLDRWFSPQPKAFCGRELDIYPPSQVEKNMEMVHEEDHQQTDTIRASMRETLGEASVTARKLYHGFTGTRYTWDGGERKGMSRATKYYNISREVERFKDMGREPRDIFQFLGILEEASLKNYTQGNDARESADEVQARGTFEIVERPYTPDSSYVIYRGRDLRVMVDNELFDSLFVRFNEIYRDLPAEYIKSASFVKDGLADDALGRKNLNRSKDRYTLYLNSIPDFYRTHSKLRGVERRNVNGFQRHIAFYHPDYSGIDIPSSEDVRRTLYWNPSVRTDSQGQAVIRFYTNSRQKQILDISVRGMTNDGRIVE